MVPHRPTKLQRAMATPLILLEQRQHEDWLIGLDPQELVAIAHQTLQNLTDLSSPPYPSTSPPLYPTILLREPSPCRFLAYFIAACSFPCTVVLCNPTWAGAEWQQVLELVKPDFVIEGVGIRAWGLGKEGSREWEVEQNPQTENSKLQTPNSSALSIQSSVFSPQSLILIPTGGSSGKVRFATHTWDTLAASVMGFRQHFQIDQVNSLCVLPLYHVSGLMQFLRSLLSSGTFAIVPFKSFQFGDLPPLPSLHFFLSLVPTQLQRLIGDWEFGIGNWTSAGNLRRSEVEQNPQTQNSKLKTSPFSPLSSTHLPIHSLLPTPYSVLLGGAPVWDELLTLARRYSLPVALTYGMTETASQIATLKPEEFLQGKTSCGRVLPHARVTIRDEMGNELAANQIGRVEIVSASLMLGYFPQKLDQPEFLTEDLGFLDQDGYLHIVGRRDGTIITGGENVYPIEVEAAIWATGLVQDVCVVGLPDAEWGQAVTAVYVPTQVGTIDTLKTKIASHLSRYKQPKHWIEVTELPRNAQGKVNRQQVMTLISTHRRMGAAPSAANLVTDDAIASLHQCTHDE